MPWRRFVVFTTIGAVLWVALWAPLGYLAGDHIGTIYADIVRYVLPGEHPALGVWNRSSWIGSWTLPQHGN